LREKVPYPAASPQFMPQTGPKAFM